MQRGGRQNCKGISNWLVQDMDEEYEAALERRRLEVEAERRMQEEEDARLLRALAAQHELPGGQLSCGISAKQPFASEASQSSAATITKDMPQGRAAMSDSTNNY